MQVVLLNDTRADPNPGCQATVSTLVRQLAVTLDAEVCTRPRGEGYAHFAPLAGNRRAHDPSAWYHALSALGRDEALNQALAAADLVVANLEGTFHHHSVGALALGGALALAHRLGRPVWAVNGSVEAIDPWLLAATLMPAAQVTVREPWSARWLRARGVAATTAADAAFLAENFAARPQAPAVTTAAFYTPGVLSGIAPSHEGAVAAIAAELTALADAGWAPTFVQIEERESPLSDAVARLGWPVADARHVAWPTFGNWLRHFGLVVSGRYHVLIFAAMAGVPAIARPSNTHKIEGLLELLGRAGTLAGDLSSLVARLAAGPPAPVDMATIRACQRLARVGIAGPARALAASAVEAPPLIAGLDWTVPAALPDVLAELYASGPPRFDTALATTPLDTGRDQPTRVRTAAEWHDQFEAAGFVVGGERLVPLDRDDGGAHHPTPLVNPLRDPAAGARRVVTLRRGAARPAPSRLTTARPDLVAADTHVRFVIGDTASFVRLAPYWRASPAGRCSLVIRSDADDAAWTAAQNEIASWGRSLDIDVLPAGDPRNLDWHLPAARGLLVATPPTCGRSRTFPGAFLATARMHGWDSAVLDAGPPCRAADGDTHAPPLASLLGTRVEPARGGVSRPLRVALFGASSLGQTLARRLGEMAGLTLLCVLDNDATKWDQSIAGAPVVQPDQAALDAADVIVVASMHADAITAQTTAAGHGHKLVFDLAVLDQRSPQAAMPAIA